jgi:hypothetical protein
MKTFGEAIEDFFAAYELRFNEALGETHKDDVEATAEAFASCFIESTPNGVICGRNDEQFRAMIPKGNEFYRSIGTKSMKITNLEVTALDDFHAVAKVHWDSRYERKNGQEVQIEFDVIYLVQIIHEKPKIFGYITGDEQKVLKEHGLI